jgi:hypothetical protein
MSPFVERVGELDSGLDVEFGEDRMEVATDGVDGDAEG